MSYMWLSIAGILLLLSNGWLEVATARPDQSFGDLNRTLTQSYGPRCDSSSLSVRISRYCDILDGTPNMECCDSIFATLGRKDCICKVVREPNYRSSPISGNDFIVDLYHSCDGGPYISPTSETDCDQTRQPPPTPPSPPNTKTAEGDLKGLLSFWRKVGWTASLLLILVLLSFVVWSIWNRVGCSWFPWQRGNRLGGGQPESNRWSPLSWVGCSWFPWQRGNRLGGGQPQPNWWSRLSTRAEYLWNSMLLLAHDTGLRARGLFARYAANATETGAEARRPTWNIIVNNVFVCNFGFSRKIMDQGLATEPGNSEPPAFVSPEGGTPFTSGQEDAVEENPESSLLR